MSRALDAETVSSLQKANVQTVYKDIAAALSTPTFTSSSDPELFEIEFLPKSHPLPPDCNVLIEGNSIALTKVKLVQAFMVSRQIFFKNYRREERAAEVEKELRDVTAVMLLLDPEHLTAANTRKRLIWKYENGSGTRSRSEMEALLRNELRFVDGYLTSRLHRHTKSPSLWGHRRWILERLKGLGMPRDVLRDLELVVFVAAERHPRNYYAWSHMRWLVQVFGKSAIRPGDDSTNRPDHSELTSVVKDWCLRNPSDTSGFSFLLFCIFNLGASTTSARSEICVSVCADVLRLAVSFKWTHESVWVFLRTVVASKIATGSVRIDFFQAIETISIARPDGKRVLSAAKEWCLQNQQTSEQ